MSGGMFREAREAQAQAQADLLSALGAVPDQPKPKPTPDDPVAAINEAMAARNASLARALGVLPTDDE